MLQNNSEQLLIGQREARRELVSSYKLHMVISASAMFTQLTANVGWEIKSGSQNTTIAQTIYDGLVLLKVLEHIQFSENIYIHSKLYDLNQQLALLQWDSMCLPLQAVV